MAARLLYYKKTIFIIIIKLKMSLWCKIWYDSLHFIYTVVTLLLWIEQHFCLFFFLWKMIALFLVLNVQTSVCKVQLNVLIPTPLLQILDTGRVHFLSRSRSR